MASFLYSMVLFIVECRMMAYSCIYYILCRDPTFIRQETYVSIDPWKTIQTDFVKYMKKVHY